MLGIRPYGMAPIKKAFPYANAYQQSIKDAEAQYGPVDLSPLLEGIDIDAILHRAEGLQMDELMRAIQNQGPLGGYAEIIGIERICNESMVRQPKVLRWKRGGGNTR